MKNKFLFLAISFCFACSAPVLHKDLHEDTNILIRRWTLPTAKNLDRIAGDRGFEFSNTLVVDNMVLFGSRSVGLIALYPKLLLTRWVLPIAQGVVSEIHVEKDTAYFGGGDGFLYAVNIDTGRVIWRYDLHNPTISKPTVAQGRVFVTTSDDTVFAFDASTGKWLWHYRRRSAGQATIHSASAPLVDGNEVIVGLSDGFVISLLIPDGQLQWEKKLSLSTKFTDVDASAVLDTSSGAPILFLPSYDGALYSLKRKGGEVIWRFDSGGAKTVSLENDYVYLPSSDGVIYKLQKSNAKVIWKFELDKGVPTKLIITDRYIIAGSSHQYLYVLDKTTGKGLYRYSVGYDSGFYGAPAFDQKKQWLYLLSGGGNLYSFELRRPPRKLKPHAVGDPYRFESYF